MSGPIQLQKEDLLPRPQDGASSLNWQNHAVSQEGGLEMGMGIAVGPVVSVPCALGDISAIASTGLEGGQALPHSPLKPCSGGGIDKN